MVEFHRVEPENIAYLPQSFTDLLAKAVLKSPTSDLTVEDAMAYAQAGTGEIVGITDGSKLIGCVFFMYGKGRDGLILDVALLGGNVVMKHMKAIREYAINLSKSKGCIAIWVMGREGWGKVFPDMKPIGIIYELKI